eukprot:jgi/Psemu1/29997/gm1.29997_g
MLGSISAKRSIKVKTLRIACFNVDGEGRRILEELPIVVEELMVGLRIESNAEKKGGLYDESWKALDRRLMDLGMKQEGSMEDLNRGEINEVNNE